MAVAYPTVEQVRSWLKLGVDSITDLTVILDAEISTQHRMCRVPVTIPPSVPDPLYAAILRRCARAWAARALALGMVDGSAEYGPARIPAADSEIERLERPWRIVVFG